MWKESASEEASSAREANITLNVFGTVRTKALQSARISVSKSLYYPPFVDTDLALAVKELCVVYFSITNNRLWVEEPSYRGQSGKRYRDIQFDLYIVLNSATVELAVGYKNELLAYCETNFKESF